MPRKIERKQISLTVTAAQHAAYLNQAAVRGMSPAEYMRFLLAQDAAELGLSFPDDLPTRGKYQRK